MKVQYIDLPNILTSGLTLGKKVCVLAPGPNGKNHYHEIPDNFSIIAVNKAVLIKEVNPHWWLIAHTDTDWFDLADQNFTGVRAYYERINSPVSETARIKSKNKNFVFSVEDEYLNKHVVKPVEGCIRIGGTVSGMAIQMAYNFGAQEILLCGVDMSGNFYWDNTENKNLQPHHDHGEVWGYVKNLNPLIHYYQNELNVKITTLSKTKLDVPFYQKK